MCDNRQVLKELPEHILNNYITYCVEINSKTHKPIIKIGESMNIKQRISFLHTQFKHKPRLREIGKILLTSKSEKFLHFIFDDMRLCERSGKAIRKSSVISQHFGVFEGGTEVFDITLPELILVL